MYPHRIRLAGPWECGQERVILPRHWSNLAVPVRLRRRFGYPGRIDDYERVWLTFASVAGRALVCLNGTALGSIEGPAEFEVTRLLGERNALEVEFAARGGDAGLTGEVALEVRRTAFLRNLRVSVADGLHVRGEVAGQADEPLELYVICDRRTAAYAAVEAGKPFQVSAGLVGLENSTQPTEIRVDLVQGAEVWYREERQLDLAGGES
jgi:hypothetical protein